MNAIASIVTSNGNHKVRHVTHPFVTRVPTTLRAFHATHVTAALN
jgi:hypothetical protein